MFKYFFDILFSLQEVFNIKKLIISLYFKLLKLINKKYDCLHRIIFIVSGVTGVCFYHFFYNNQIWQAGLVILIGGGLVELINKYLRTRPEVILVTRSEGEQDEEFLKKVQNRVAKTLKEQEKDNNN